MIIERDIARFLIVRDDPVATALRRIDENRQGIVAVVDRKGVLEGVLTDGDIRRWLLAQSQVDLTLPVGRVMNTACAAASVEESGRRLRERLTPTIRFLPLLDRARRVVAVAHQGDPAAGVRLGNCWIGDTAPVFVIAEIGINHNGSEARARELIEKARDAGADCAKFQMRHMASLYRQSGGDIHAGEDLGTQYTLDLLTRFALPDEAMFRLFDYTRDVGLTPLCTPWDIASVETLERYGTLPGYKVASADLTHHDLLNALAQTGKPLIVSTGMATEDEIRASVRLLQERGVAYVLLHCNSTYPAPFKDIHLRYLARLKEIGGCCVGYSGHERGYAVSVAAVALGARCIEKHITLDRTLEGNDHKVSLLPDEFRAMVQAIRQTDEALGSGGERRLSQGEIMNRVTLAKSLVITCDLEPGQTIRADMIEVRSPGRGLQPNRKAELVGQTARRAFRKGDFFYPSDLGEGRVQARPYAMQRPWGVPVRWHDFKTILAKSNPDFLEFHLSYRDMEVDFASLFDHDYALGLVVHSPDTFAGDHLLDLSNDDPAHRARSIRELQRVVDLTRALKPRFLKTPRPLIVVSLGGFTKDGPLDKDGIAARYSLLARSLGELDTAGVEIIGQTLPPFPWYFGGQLYLNLFVHAEDTAAFCREQNLRLCFDVCHSRLVCNHFKDSFRRFVETVGPHTAHLHIADASGVDGEGLQIGEGDIDFPALADDLRATCPTASFIPEIWQGHKNDGEGFWTAMERLEGLF